MPRIKCHYSAAAVEIDPDTGCNTYSPAEGAAKKDDDWDEEEDSEEWDEEDGDEEDDEWLDEEDEF
jgi:hypothetical protein